MKKTKAFYWTGKERKIRKQEEQQMNTVEKKRVEEGEKIMNE